MSKQAKGKAPAPKKVQKAVEDKTFGMKNKKGKKGQVVAKQVQNTGVSKLAAQKQREAEERKRLKKEAEDRRKEEALLLGRPVQKPQTCPPGVDPKSILCIYFKKGCMNGTKCRFGHDLALENASQKRDMFTDSRDVKDEDTMDEWDDKTLQEAVKKKAASNKKANPTAKICKNFLQAIENRKYGWFWECPNGDACIYRHALPPGYVLAKSKTKTEEVERPLEDVLEEERAKLPPGGTPVTDETFAKWRAQLMQARAAQAEADKGKRRDAIKGGARLTGRELLSQNAASLGGDDDGEEELDVLSLRRQKLAEEEAIDAENARIAAALAAEYADVEVDDPNVEKLPASDTQSPVEVDAALFDAEEELPDFGEEDDEEEKKDKE